MRSGKSVKQRMVFIIVLCFLCIVGNRAFGDGNLSIHLKIPAIASEKALDSKTFFLRSISDKRFFGGLSSPVDVPSWGIDEKERTETMKARAVGRAVLRDNRKEGNVLIGKGDVKSIIGEAIRISLRTLGYRIIEKEEEITPETIIIDVSIVRFWGYIREAFIGGAIHTDIKTEILLKKREKTEKRVTLVSGKRSMRYPNKPENWELVFNTALSDYTNAIMHELKK